MRNRVMPKLPRHAKKPSDRSSVQSLTASVGASKRAGERMPQPINSDSSPDSPAPLDARIEAIEKQVAKLMRHALGMCPCNNPEHDHDGTSALQRVEDIFEF